MWIKQFKNNKMKNIKQILTIAVLGTVLFTTSCKKDLHCDDKKKKADSEVNIEFAEKLGQDAELKVYNSLGQLVLCKSLIRGKKQISIELDNLNPGIYLFEVLGDKKVLGVGKFVVE